MSKQKKIFVPTENAISWKKFLADEDLHWKEGYSAMSIAMSWELSEGFPNEILNLLFENEFNDIELLLAIPEYKVSLPGGQTASQNDVLAIFTSKTSLSVMAVEGKARESFGETISNWKIKTSETGIKERLSFILEKIGIKDKEIDSLRYQLFHRLASAVIMAEKFHAKNAIMIVQSFNDNDYENHFNDYCNFLHLYSDDSIEKQKLYKLTSVNGINLFAGWVYTDWRNNAIIN